MEPKSLYPALIFIRSANVCVITDLVKSWILELKEESEGRTNYYATIPNLIQEHYWGLNDFNMNWLSKILYVLKDIINDED